MGAGSSTTADLRESAPHARNGMRYPVIMRDPEIARAACSSLVEEAERARRRPAVTRVRFGLGHTGNVPDPWWDAGPPLQAVLVLTSHDASAETPTIQRAPLEGERNG